MSESYLLSVKLINLIQYELIIQWYSYNKTYYNTKNKLGTIPIQFISYKLDQLLLYVNISRQIVVEMYFPA